MHVKGTHAAVDRYTEFSRKNRYVLKCDLRKFFPSLDHEILLSILARKIGCRRTLHLLRLIVESSNPQEPVAAYFPGDDLFTPHERAYAARALGEAFVALGKRADAEAVLTQLGQWPAPGSREPAVADASAWVVLSLLESDLAAGELGDALKLLPRLKALQPDRFETGCRSVLLAAAEAGDAATVAGVREQAGAASETLAPSAAVEVALLLSKGKAAEAEAAIRGVTDRELSLALWTRLVQHVTAHAGGEAAVVAATAEALAALPANPPPRADDTPFGFNAADTTPLLAALMEARQYGRAIDVASPCDRPTEVGEALLTALRPAISERNWQCG